MWSHRYLASVGPAAALSEIADQFFARIELRARWLVAIEVADQTNAERNVVQVIAVHVAAVDLAAPAIAHFNLAITGRGSVANHKMIGQTVLHSAHVPMVIVEYARVSLSRAAIVDDNELPASSFYRRATDCFDD